MSATKVLVSTSSFGMRDAAPLEALQDAGLEAVLNPHGRTLTAHEVVELAAGCVGIVAGTEPLGRDVLAKLPELKVISRVGTGMDSVDQAAAAELGIAVANTPDAPTPAVAELTVALMLDLLRGVSRSDARVRQGTWKKEMGSLLAGKTVGIVGLGRIGRRVAALVHCFGCDVLGCDTCADVAWAIGEGIRTVGFSELLHASDIVTLHVPCPTESVHMIGVDELSSMKAGSYLVNAARGELVDEEALVRALRSGHLAGAALDVFEKEPYEGPLAGMSNVVLSPHVGSYAIEARVAMERGAVANLLKALGLG